MGNVSRRRTRVPLGAQLSEPYRSVARAVGLKILILVLVEISGRL